MQLNSLLFWQKSSASKVKYFDEKLQLLAIGKKWAYSYSIIQTES